MGKSENSTCWKFNNPPQRQGLTFLAIQELRMEAKARRVARKAGLVVHKSRERDPHVHDLGGLQLVDPSTTKVVAGLRFELSPEDVIELCAHLEN